MLWRLILPVLCCFSPAYAAAPLLLEDPRPAQPASAPREVVDWLKEHRTASTEIPRELFASAKDNGPASRVFLVGRAANGTSEIARFEASVWRVAAAESGFDQLAVDVGWAEGLSADEFVQSGKGNAAAIAAAFGPWGWSTSEIVELLESMQRANAETKGKKKSFVGIGTGSSRLLCEPALEFLRKAYPDGFMRAELIIQALRTDGRDGRSKYYQSDDNERAVAQFGLDELISIVRDQKDLFTQRTSATEYARGLAFITALVQCEQAMRFDLTGGDSDPRGRILAENTAAALARAGEGSRILVLTHVRDLARASDPDSMAAQLEKYFQMRAVCIATAVGEASFQAFDPNDHAAGKRVPRDLVLDSAGRTVLERALSDAGAGSALFDLRKAPSAGTAAEWFGKPRTLRSARPWIGAASEAPWDFQVTRDFDFLVWLERAPRVREKAGK